MDTKAQTIETHGRVQFRKALETAYADLFANNADYAYSASKTSPAELAKRMLNAAVTGSINIDGEGVRRACKACGIKHTLRAVLEFVGHALAEKTPVAPRVSRKVQVICLSNIHAMMTGVARIYRAHDLVTLEYVDGKRESGKVSSAEWSGMADNAFAIVSAVQSQRVSF